MKDEQEMRDEGGGGGEDWGGGGALKLQVESNADAVRRSEKSSGLSFIFNLLYTHEENHISQSQCCPWHSLLSLFTF